jgi:hypothetical protein
LDERRQRGLTRYYHAAGAGGLAVGVHTTQFEIRDPKHNLFQPVIELAVKTLEQCDRASGRRTVRIAGICGDTSQAINEAHIALEFSYDLGLLSLASLQNADEDALINHCLEIAQIIPLIGFYLQPAVGGRILPFSFWRRFAEIPNVVAIKIAPFNRYQTLDVIRAVAESGREGDIALYTGNDDLIVFDLISEYVIPVSSGIRHLVFAGGLLGHWACWTKIAVDIQEKCKAARKSGQIPKDLLMLATQVTDCNAAFFDVANQYAGVIAGIHEVLRRQGLLENIFCLDPKKTLSPGQSDEIDRVYRSYPHLNDDEFVHAHLDEWLN